MKPLSIVTAAIALGGVLVSTPALAQQSQGGTPPHLHVNDAHRDCFFDLHPELTQAEFQEFTAELGSILRFRQLGDVAPRGRGHFDIGVQFASSRIDDSKGAWNNTMSHPTAHHALGRSIQFPRIVARLGVSNRVDIGVERSEDVTLQNASAGATVSYAGLSYRWRTLVLSAEAEKGELTSYAFRMGTRF